MNRQTKFFETLRKKGIKASYYSMLIALDNHELIPIQYLQPLEKDGWTNNGMITDKGRELINYCDRFFRVNMDKVSYTWTQEEEAIVKQYHDMFPKGLLPSGSSARCSMKELKKRFADFFVTYDYPWSTILKATQIYLDKQQQEDYKYCQTSAYLIMKDKYSKLADLCQMVEEGIDNTPQGFKTQVL